MAAFVATDGGALSAKSAEVVVFVSTGGGAISARNVEQEVFHSTGGGAVTAKILEAATPASMGDGAVNARAVEAAARRLLVPRQQTAQQVLAQGVLAPMTTCCVPKLPKWFVNGILDRLREQIS